MIFDLCSAGSKVQQMPQQLNFFLKNIHPEMRNAASDLFGLPDYLQSRPNVFGELMRVLISPSEDVEDAVNWVLKAGLDPDISLHMRMLMNRYCD